MASQRSGIETWWGLSRYYLETLITARNIHWKFNSNRIYRNVRSLKPHTEIQDTRKFFARVFLYFCVCSSAVAGSIFLVIGSLEFPLRFDWLKQRQLPSIFFFIQSTTLDKTRKKNENTTKVVSSWYIPTVSFASAFDSLYNVKLKNTTIFTCQIHQK